MNDVNINLPGLKTILHRAQDYCALQERCRYDVALKLMQWGVDKDRSAKIIELLEKANYINESRYAEIFAGSKFRLKKWGRNKIAYELRLKKISGEAIDQSLTTINDSDYQKTIQLLITQKKKEIKEKDVFKMRQKIARYLVSRGFEPDLAFAALKISEMQPDE